MPLCQQDYLAQVTSLIADRLKPLKEENLFGTSANALHQACRHLCLSPHAKRARPLLCLYSHWLFSEDVREDFINIGAAAELIHAASLLHDDIIDDADKRRGVTTTNRLYGNKIAVLAGDYLLTEAFNLLLPFERILIDRAITVVREMTKAAVMELNARGKINLSPTDVQKIALGKTGLLFSWCGFAASIVCNRHDATDNLWQFGQHIGVLFQLADDIKDFDGDKNLKDVCRDIRNLDPSMPLVLALEESDILKDQFTNLLAAGEISEVKALELREMVKATKALEKSRAMVKIQMKDAQALLQRFEGKGKTSFSNFVLDIAQSQ